jgi:hypothetical protein
MALVPTPTPTPVTPPDGSSSIDSGYFIDAQLLNYLSNSGKSKILSASNIGASTISVIEKSLEKIDALSDLTDFLIDETLLDNLSDGSSTSSIIVSNVGSSNYVRIVIVLGAITPTIGGTIVISDGTDSYELSVSTANSVKRLEFNNIPSAFISSFTITNSTGVSLASWGNSVLVVGL